MRKRVITVNQIQSLDRMAIEKYGVPSLCLMENAGKSVSEVVLGLLKRGKKPKVSIICGLGNNAGDGFVAARHLINAGVNTSIFLIGRGNELKYDAAVNYNILRKLKYTIKKVRNGRDRSVLSINNSDIIVDAIFGVGLNRDIKEPYRGIIESINRSGKRIVSIDTPSGLDGTSGQIYGICVKAHTTVTFTFAKRGFERAQGPKFVGNVIVVDIGIPKKLIKRM